MSITQKGRSFAERTEKVLSGPVKIKHYINGTLYIYSHRSQQRMAHWILTPTVPQKISIPITVRIKLTMGYNIDKILRTPFLKNLIIHWEIIKLNFLVIGIQCIDNCCRLAAPTCFLIQNPETQIQYHLTFPGLTIHTGKSKEITYDI